MTEKREFDVVARSVAKLDAMSLACGPDLFLHRLVFCLISHVPILPVSLNRNNGLAQPDAVLSTCIDDPFLE